MRTPTLFHGLAALSLALCVAACDSPDTCADTGTCAPQTTQSGGSGGGGASPSGPSSGGGDAGSTGGQGGASDGPSGTGGGGDGEGGAGGEGGEAPALLQISGVVVSDDGTPASGATAILNDDFTHPATTGADGSFAFKDVSAPYDLTVVYEGPQLSTVMTLKGLTSDSVRVPLSLLLDEAHMTALQGTITGSFFPLGASQRLIGSTCNGPGQLDVNTDHLFTNTVVWSGPAARSCDLIGLYVDGTSIRKAGSLPVSVAPSVGQTGLTLPIDQDVATKPTTIDLDPGAYSLRPSVYLSAVDVLGKRALLFNSLGSSSGTAFDVPADGGTIRVEAQDSLEGPKNQAIVLAPAVLDGTTTFSLPSAIALKAGTPLNEATGVSTTPVLSWSAVAGAQNYYLMISGGSRRYAIVLPAGTTSFSFDGYAALGAALGVNTNYTWMVYATDTDVFTPDRVVDGTGDAGLYGFYGKDAGWLYSTASRTFATGN